MEGYENNHVVEEWIQGVYVNRGINAELTLKYCAEIERYALEENDGALLGFSYFYQGETYYGLNDGENLFKYIAKSLTYLDQSGQRELMVRAYNILAITSGSRGNVPVSMDYYLAGLNYCKKYGLTEEENMINLNLGSLYMNHSQYAEAQGYFEKVQDFLNRHQGEEKFLAWQICVSMDLGKCYMMRGMMERAKEYYDKIDEEYLQKLDHVEVLAVLCFKAGFYHKMGREQDRDRCIEEIHQQMNEDFAIMDIFDDLYDFCLLLLELKRDDVLWDTLTVLETLTKRAEIVNLQRKIIGLKIKYYRSIGENAGYLQAAGLFYELTEVTEKENQYMITSMINVRNSLEKANEQRKKAEEANQKLLKKSETDQLTGLSNRYRLNDYSEKVFERCMETGRPMAVEILDIDYFKQYNDNYGHQKGDQCIFAVAGQLKAMQNEKIFCARYGGDEFIVIYEDMSRDEVLSKAEELRKRIMELKIEHLYSQVLPLVTITQGICYAIPEHGNKNWDFLHVADMMLYRVKKQRRNDICMGSLEEESDQTPVS